MRFLELPPGRALGGRLAHSLKLGDRRVAKGTLVDEALAARLEAAPGVARVAVAMPEPGDVHEDAAAARVAGAFAGEGLRAGTASTGRANLYATRAGLFAFEREAVLAANAVDEGVTLATLAENLVVAAGRMVATVKIIPFAVTGDAVEAAVHALAPARVAASAPRRAALVQTELDHLSARALDKTRRVTEGRLVARGATLVGERRCDHDVGALAAALADAAALRPDWLLIVGASAIADRRDVIPAAVERLGGEILRFGLPVDPGNLLLVGRLGGAEVIGLPGCARSPRDNGLDRVLDRLAHGLPLDAAWLESLAVGGLLDEIVERGAPRRPERAGVGTGGPSPRSADRPGARAAELGLVVLAAGLSRRAGPANKLLRDVPGFPGESMVRRVTRTALEAASALAPCPVTVVTGHERERIERELAGLDVALVHNPDAGSGLAGSLVRGVSAQLEGREDAGPDALVVCLADMPHVDAATLVELVEARRGGTARPMIVPTFEGRRGNPVLVGREWFDELLALRGDEGARALARRAPDAVLELEVDDPGVLIDHDRATDFD